MTESKAKKIVLSHEHIGIMRIINNVDRAVFNGLTKRLSTLGLSHIQALVIIYLYANRNGENYQIDLEREFGLTNPTMTASLKSMLKKGLISKTKSETDGRYYKLALTDAGAALYTPASSVYEELQGLFDSILTPEESDHYVEISQKIIQVMKSF
ncbi:MarR family winged helix-turn-helix transcriptional regulator [Loigolactobacillus coryniformis]|uniref:MarR family winged helix-turn-helix transcriptional regulator n=1 Tax=Loigolactobacillus coryniformis TaxID=1610 RepID=UPI00021923A8|nr:MarR family winged helix-turn-helix transcriptional regulator [Loigolactobacillus coryniformis]